jgi:hypothetical protein
MNTTMTTLDKIKADPRVADAYKEFDDSGDFSYWIHLAPGIRSPEMDCHTIHEPTVRKAFALLRTTRPCACGECCTVQAANLGSIAARS